MLDPGKAGRNDDAEGAMAAVIRDEENGQDLTLTRQIGAGGEIPADME